MAKAPTTYAAPPVTVEGLIPFQKELRAANAAFPRLLRVANKEAAEMVAEEARRNASSQGGAARKTAPSIKALAQQRNASVKIGGKAYPYALGAEFGAIVYKQFKPWRGNQHNMPSGISFDEQTTGYFLYPAIRAKRGEVMDAYGELVNKAMDKAFPD